MNRRELVPFTILVLVVLVLLGVGILIGQNITIAEAAPAEQGYPSVQIQLEATMEYNWALYSRQIADTDERALIVIQVLGNSATDQCQYNISNTGGGVQLSTPMQLPNGSLAYDLFINRSVTQGAEDFLHSLENQTLGDLLHSAQNLDLGDLEIGDIHGSIIIPSDASVTPSITC